jgi:hypothetical protein
MRPRTPQPPGSSVIRLLIDIVAVAAGLALGAVAGFAIGQHWESDRRMLWTIASAAFATAWIVDFAGYVSGHPEIAIGSIGLMAGLLTGVKYGGFADVRVWEPRPPAPPKDDEPAERDEARAAAEPAAADVSADREP